MTNTPEQNNTEQKSAPSKARKTVGIIFDVILYAFLAICLAALIFSAVAQKNNGATNLFGYEMRVVVSDSMAKSQFSVPVDKYKVKDIPVGSMVFIQRVPEDEQQAKEWYDSLQEGDVLTFCYVTAVTQDVITHRLTKKTPTANGYVLRLEGDNRAKQDGVVSYQQIYTSAADYPDSHEQFNYVIGKVVGKSVVLGYIAYGLTKPVGIALIVILPCALIIIWQVLRIVNVVNEERKRKAAVQVDEAKMLAEQQAEQSRRQAEELEKLKRKIAEMEKKQSDNGEGGEDDNAG